MTSAPGSCPICGKPEALAYRPFCSKRCADVDLQRWFTGGYVLSPVDEPGGKGDPEPS